MPSEIIRSQLQFTPFHCFEIHVGPQTARAAHTHDTHEFLVCINGHGTQFVDRTEIPQHRANFFCFPAGMPHHASGTATRTADVYVLMVPESMFSPETFGDRETLLTIQRVVHLARDGQNPLPIGRKTADRLLPLARDMVLEFSGKKPGYQPATRLLLQNLFLHLMRDPAVGIEAGLRSGRGRHHDAVARALQFIDSHFMEEITVEQMARMAGMSRSHFHAIFRSVAGSTLIDYVTRIRVRTAKRLLRESDAPIIQIAMDCGFQSLSRFYEAFTAIVGKTPRAVRQAG
jgi:AraC-like DNA-binding protein